MHSPLTGAKKKIASAVCVLGIVALCLGVVGYQNKLKAEDNLPVMTRGVVDKINQIPESKRDIYDKNADAAKLGTKENPFLILEIVPYVEYSTIGYQIEGCEPLEVEKMGADSYISTIGSFGGGTAGQGEAAWFFKEEVDQTGDLSAFTEYGYNPYDLKKIKGYYELVDTGTGSFQQNEDGTIVKSSKGNIVWHSLLGSELSNEYKDQTFQSPDEKKNLLKQKGDRIYTIRVNSENDPVYVAYDYRVYRSSNNFLIQSLGLSKEEAKNYSVIIKTITPQELNANPDWVKYADLYIATAKMTMVGNGEWETYKAEWNRYNRYQHNATSSSNESSFEDVEGQNDRDISWQIALAMYNKITADINYAPIVMTSSSYMNASQKKEIKTQIFDWNLNFSGYYDEATRPAYNNNMYKLAVMLFSMKSELFKKLYLDKDNPLIVDGKYLNASSYKNENDEIVNDKQTAQNYWSMFTFMLSDANGERPSPKHGNSWYQYWANDQEKWDNYGVAGNITDEVNQGYVNDRLFVCKDDGSISQKYTSQNVPAGNQDSRYTDFKTYLDDNKPNGHGKGQATPADAVRYVLGLKKNTNNKIKGDLEVLDIEPCYDSKNGYSLTKNYIYIMLPNFDGKVNITHMTTAEFIGNSEDLNSTYNMIFMGLDDGAYNKEQQTLKDPTENKEVSGQFTKWNDSAMNGKIYFHTGDLAKSTPYREGDPRVSRSVKFLWFENNRESTTQDEDYPVIRFPGNDITKVKQKELSAFLDAGYPIVAIPYLYETNQLRIDQNSNICKFIKDEKNDKSPIYQTLDATSIESALKRAQADIEWKELPAIYNGETASESSSTIKDANYLNTDTNGRSLLTFKFTVKDTDANHKYKYRIYIDQNRDGKFEDDEIFYDARKTIALNSEQTRTLKISKLYVGLIQWKIEVYRTDNQQIRFTKTGCSAAKNRTGFKKQIKVLQIMPNDKNKGTVNLKEDGIFTKYYENLNDYEISVDTKTVDEYKALFHGDNRFSFDESSEINLGGEGQQNPSEYSDDVKTQLYDKYNMLIIGFGDCYVGDDISNEDGAVDFIKYFAAKGKSVLFTHDLTSMNNVKVQNQGNPFGYSANALLRDLMGMNRYKAVSNQISAAERNKIIRYQEKQRDEQGNNKYDFVKDVNGNALDELHGFTYYAIKRLAYDQKKPDENDWYHSVAGQWVPYEGEVWKMPYQYLIKDVDVNGNIVFVCPDNWQTQNTGFNNHNDETTLVTKTNEGQITQYPYKIGDLSNHNTVFDDTKLKVAKTHGQYYQLNMEDPEVTVWYCLADGKDRGNGKSDTYGVSPNDASNNYYIYSKDNIFYSGVGHSKVESDMEAKLFINTMIGAYRVSYEPPIVEVLNPEAEITDTKNLSYTMTYNQEYDGDTTEILSQKAVDTANEGVGSDADSDMVKVWFSPVELNAISTRLSFSIYYTDGNSGEKHYVTTIYHVNEDDKVDTLTTNESRNWVYADEKNAQGDYITDNIHSMDEYYFYYPKAYLSENWKDKDGNVHANARRNITFEIKNNKIKETGYTKLNMQTQALFLLD